MRKIPDLCLTGAEVALGSRVKKGVCLGDRAEGLGKEDTGGNVGI